MKNIMYMSVDYISDISSVEILKKQINKKRLCLQWTIKTNYIKKIIDVNN